MAVYRWHDGNGGIWGYQEFPYFDVTSMTTTVLQGQYNGNDGPYDPFSHAWSLDASITGASLYTIQEGPDAGNQVYNGGTVTGFDYYNNASQLLISITGLSIDLASFYNFASQGFYLWDYVATGKNTFIGSNDSMGNNWDGDDIVTGSGKDLVKARGGDDYITDKGGADVYKGGAGSDTVTYDNWQWYSGLVKSGIVANLTKGWIEGPDGKTDTVVSIENVRGTFLEDVFIGNAENNRFVGMQGDDVFKGKGGFDMVQYHRDANRGGTDGVIVDLANKTARDGFGNTDTLKSIEGAYGTRQNDVFIDDGKDNWFGGDDGDDVFKFHGGNDGAEGGAGADEFQFLGGAFGRDEIEDYNQGEGDSIVIEGPANFAALTISQNGSHAEIDWAGNTIVLLNFDSNNLTAGDFTFI